MGGAFGNLVTLIPFVVAYITVVGIDPLGLLFMCAPNRPNPIGISVVRLVKVEGCTLHIVDGK
jgi:hypothetical protein